MPIGVDAPDLLEQIQRQVSSWDPRLVPDTRRRGSLSSAGDDLPDPARSMADIAGVVRVNMSRFRTCHGVGQRSSIHVGGDVQVRLLIAAHGSVLEAHAVGGSFPDDAVRRCVVRAFHGLRFPPPPGAAPETVTFPLSLVAGDVSYGPGAGEP